MIATAPRARPPAAPTKASALLTAAGVVVLAVAIRLIAGVGFANYDTLYALLWGQQAAHGHTPQYDVPIAPTPHPLVEALGFVLTPFGPGAMQTVTVALGFLALAGCAIVVYRLGALWFGRAAGAVAGLLLVTRVPVVSYGVRAYIDVPYLLCVLGAVLAESRRPRAGAPVLGLLGVAGLLRPEAWVFSALYWLYLFPSRSRGEMARLAALAAVAPVLWVGSDWLVTGNPFWSLTHTTHDATTLDRTTGVRNVPEYIPRRIGEILGPAALGGAAVGGILSLLWLRDRARLLAIVGVVAVAVFAVFASIGLPINTRYAFFAAAILCVFCGAGLFGWRLLRRDDPHRRWWMAASALIAVALVVTIPDQVHGVRSQLDSLSGQQQASDDLVALVHHDALRSSCLPIGVPNHLPVPLLALELVTSPHDVIPAQTARVDHGAYVVPADKAARDLVLDPRDPANLRTLPGPLPGFTLSAVNRSWRVYERCA